LCTCQSSTLLRDRCQELVALHSRLLGDLDSCRARAGYPCVSAAQQSHLGLDPVARQSRPQIPPYFGRWLPDSAGRQVRSSPMRPKFPPTKHGPHRTKAASGGRRYGPKSPGTTTLATCCATDANVCFTPRTTLDNSSEPLARPVPHRANRLLLYKIRCRARKPPFTRYHIKLKDQLPRMRERAEGGFGCGSMTSRTTWS